VRARRGGKTDEEKATEEACRVELRRVARELFAVAEKYRALGVPDAIAAVMWLEEADRANTLDDCTCEHHAPKDLPS